MQWEWCFCSNVLEELWMCLGEGRPLLWLCCSHHCHLFGFLAPLVMLFCTALWHCHCSERDRLLSKLIRGAVAALLMEESYPLTRSPRRMKSFQTGKLPGLQWWFWFLKLHIPVLFNNLNGFGVGLFTEIASKKWIQIAPCPRGQGSKNMNFLSFQEWSWRLVL